MGEGLYVPTMCCALGSVGDEKHVVLECPAIGEARKKFVNDEMERGGQFNANLLNNGGESEKQRHSTSSLVEGYAVINN